MARAVSVGPEHLPTARLEITLSERNLLALLSKLYIEGSARTLEIPGPWPHTQIALMSERDDVHYKERVLGPGPMSDETLVLSLIIKNALNEHLGKKNADSLSSGEPSERLHSASE